MMEDNARDPGTERYWRISSVSEARLAELRAEIDAKAQEYHEQYHNLTEGSDALYAIRGIIWNDLWQMRAYLYNIPGLHQYHTRTAFRGFECGDDFLDSVMNDNIGKILQTYRPERCSSFISYFISKMKNAVWNEVRNLYHRQCEIMIQVPTPTVYIINGSKKLEKVDITLKQNRLYNVTGRTVLSSGSILYEFELESHGKRYCIKEEDVITFENTSEQPIDDKTTDYDTEESGCSEVGVYNLVCADDLIDTYFLELQALVVRLCNEKQPNSVQQIRAAKKLTNFDVYRMLYTDAVVDRLQKIYEVLSTLPSMRLRNSVSEKMVLLQAMQELIDYIMTRRGCNTYDLIMKTPLKKYSDFSYWNEDRELDLPLAGKVYVKFICDEIGINRSPDGIEVTMSKYRNIFNNQLIENGLINT